MVFFSAGSLSARVKREKFHFSEAGGVVKRLFLSSASKLDTVPVHTPVMREEVAQYLNLKDGDTVIDMTFGSGGHSKYLLEKYPNLKIFALDRDPVAHEFAKKLAKDYPEQVIPLLGKFSDLLKFRNNGIPLMNIDGIVFDLGTSAMQLDVAERGFALSMNGPLDMRMDRDTQITAAAVVNYSSEEDLFKIFKCYGEEKSSRKIARGLVQSRYTFRHLTTTKELANAIEVISSKPGVDKIKRRTHPGTKIFQALRIFVNNELNELNSGLIGANLCLKNSGRMVVLTFHSLEDKIVKRHIQGHIFDQSNEAIHARFISFRPLEDGNVLQQPWKVINKKVVVPKNEEVSSNPRSRSAKLRAAEKVTDIECIAIG